MCACKILQRWYQTLCPWNFHWDLTRKSTAEVLNSVKWALLDISQSVRRNWSPGKQASISSSYSESLLECWKSVLTSLFSLRREADWRSCPQMHFHDFHSLSEGAAPSISCVEVFRTVIKKKNTLSQETRMKINHHWVVSVFYWEGKSLKLQLFFRRLCVLSICVMDTSSHIPRLPHSSTAPITCQSDYQISTHTFFGCHLWFP